MIVLGGESAWLAGDESFCSTTLLLPFVAGSFVSSSSLIPVGSSVGLLVLVKSMIIPSPGGQYFSFELLSGRTVRGSVVVENAGVEQREVTLFEVSIDFLMQLLWALFIYLGV